MPDALHDTTLPISRLGTGSTNGSNNGRGWGLQINTEYEKKFNRTFFIENRAKTDRLLKSQNCMLLFQADTLILRDRKLNIGPAIRKQV
jgi:hypothetical protein